MKHIKTFNLTEEYQDYMQEDPVLPNLSYVTDTDKIYCSNSMLIDPLTQAINQLVEEGYTIPGNHTETKDCWIGLGDIWLKDGTVEEKIIFCLGKNESQESKAILFMDSNSVFTCTTDDYLQEDLKIIKEISEKQIGEIRGVLNADSFDVKQITLENINQLKGELIYYPYIY